MATLECYFPQYNGNESCSHSKAPRDSTEDSIWHPKSTCRQAQWRVSLAVADPRRGCVSSDCKLDLVHIHGGLTAQKYTDDILRPHAEQRIDNHALANRAVFMQDGASPHTARVSQEFLVNAAIDVLLSSAKSIDISIIENIWSYISRRINCMNPLPRNDAELRAAVGNEW